MTHTPGRSTMAVLGSAFFIAVAASTAEAQSMGVAFGAAVEIVGDQVVVGEPNSVRRPGMVYVFESADDDSWAPGACTRTSKAARSSSRAAPRGCSC